MKKAKKSQIKKSQIKKSQIRITKKAIKSQKKPDQKKPDQKKPDQKKPDQKRPKKAKPALKSGSDLAFFGLGPPPYNSFLDMGLIWICDHHGISIVYFWPLSRRLTPFMYAKKSTFLALNLNYRANNFRFFGRAQLFQRCPVFGCPVPNMSNTLQICPSKIVSWSLKIDHYPRKIPVYW